MHEVSLGYTIADYLSGESIEATTYEDLRQAIARMLVERKGYPAKRLRSKVPVTFPVGEGSYTRAVDLVAYDESGRPLVLVLFCAGEVETYIREAVAAARLMEEGAPPLAVVTDTQSAALISVGDGEGWSTGTIRPCRTGTGSQGSQKRSRRTSSRTKSGSWRDGFSMP